MPVLSPASHCLTRPQTSGGWRCRSCPRRRSGSRHHPPAAAQERHLAAPDSVRHKPGALGGRRGGAAASCSSSGPALSGAARRALAVGRLCAGGARPARHSHPAAQHGRVAATADTPQPADAGMYATDRLPTDTAGWYRNCSYCSPQVVGLWGFRHQHC